MQITGVAKYTDGTLAEPNIPLTVTILDLNDNPPYFELHVGNITEASKEGTATLKSPACYGADCPNVTTQMISSAAVCGGAAPQKVLLHLW